MSERPLGRFALAALALMMIELATVVVLSASSRHLAGDRRRSSPVNRRVARELQLTDLALSTGNGYTRHPSLADVFAAHGSHPSAIDQFPAGSVIGPPRHASMTAFGPERRAQP
mgnify:CR=1 FL=1